MLLWTISRLVQNNGVYGLAPYDCVEVSEDRLHVLLEDAACVSCARPLYSGFHVQGSITSWPWDASVPLRSGNVEYGYYQATHNEEAAVVAHLATHNPGNPHPPILALVNGDHEGSLETLTMPCGNCRDILRDVIGPTCALIIGTLGEGPRSLPDWRTSCSIAMRLNQSRFWKRG